MTTLGKLKLRLPRLLIVLSLAFSGMTPLASIVTSKPVLAAACSGSGSGGGGGSEIVNLVSQVVAAPDSTVQKIGYEFTPTAVLTTGQNIFTYSTKFANSSCASVNSQVSITLDDAKKLTIDFADSGRSGAFVAGTDYNNLGAGVTVSSPTNTEAMASYTLSSMPAGTAQLISVDLSNAGFADIYLKSGSGTDTRLVSFKLPATAASFYSHNNMLGVVTFSATNGASTCSELSGSAEVKVRVLYDDVATALSAAPNTSAACASFDKTSYDAASKTASLKYDVAGATVNHVFSSGKTVNMPTNNNTIFSTTSLKLTPEKTVFTDYFTSSSSASQQLYLVGLETLDGKVLPKDTPWPVAGGVFDMSSKDLELTTAGVVLDSSPVDFKAVAHKLNTLTKDGSFSLFVPYKDGTTYVGVCAGAADLASVSDKCNGIYYLKDGQTKTSSNTKSIPSGKSVKASVITVGTKKFWQVDGLTGSGAFSASIASDPDTGLSVSATNTTVAIMAIMATLGLAVIGRRIITNKK